MHCWINHKLGCHSLGHFQGINDKHQHILPCYICSRDLSTMMLNSIVCCPSKLESCLSVRPSALFRLFSCFFSCSLFSFFFIFFLSILFSLIAHLLDHHMLLHMDQLLLLKLYQSLKEQFAHNTPVLALVQEYLLCQCCLCGQLLDNEKDKKKHEVNERTNLMINMWLEGGRDTFWKI